MKKILSFTFLTVNLFTFAFAADTANIKFKIDGALKNNRYFMCIQGLGCLSLKAAQKGRIFSTYRPVEMSNIYLLNTKTAGLIPQGLPASCNVTIDTNKTLTISAKIKASDKGAILSDLNCQLA